MTVSSRTFRYVVLADIAGRWDLRQELANWARGVFGPEYDPVNAEPGRWWPGQSIFHFMEASDAVFFLLYASRDGRVCDFESVDYPEVAMEDLAYPINGSALATSMPVIVKKAEWALTGASYLHTTIHSALVEGWCREEFGRPISRDLKSFPEVRFNDLDGRWLLFLGNYFFRSLSDATLFKLRWCGG